MESDIGAGNYGMCGRGFEPNFIFSWPNCRTATMGGEQAGRVLTFVAEERAARTGKEPDRKALEATERSLVEQFDHESRAIFASARLFDDGIIDPRHSRAVLAVCLAACREAASRQTNRNTFGVARL